MFVIEPVTAIAFKYCDYCTDYSSDIHYKIMQILINFLSFVSGIQL